MLRNTRSSRPAYEIKIRPMNLFIATSLTMPYILKNHCITEQHRLVLTFPSSEASCRCQKSLDEWMQISVYIEKEIWRWKSIFSGISWTSYINIRYWIWPFFLRNTLWNGQATLLRSFGLQGSLLTVSIKASWRRKWVASEDNSSQYSWPEARMSGRKRSSTFSTVAAPRWGVEGLLGIH